MRAVSAQTRSLNVIPGFSFPARMSGSNLECGSAFMAPIISRTPRAIKSDSQSRQEKRRGVARFVGAEDRGTVALREVPELKHDRLSPGGELGLDEAREVELIGRVRRAGDVD